MATGIRKAMNRRHELAIGPDQAAAREQLTKARTLFEDITAKGGQRVKWFQDEERRDTGQLICDLADRLDDNALKDAMNSVAASWDQAFADSPPNRIRARHMGDEPSPYERAQDTEDQAQIVRQIAAAREGIEHVKAAGKRLNKLERRLIGRS